MKQMKRFLALLLCLALLPTAALADAQKEEVIYALLAADGSVEHVYAVNIFPGGVVTDYGDYASVRMMNTEDEIYYRNGMASFSSWEDRVYYQGDMEQAPLPWNFSIAWMLNGVPMSAHRMAGARGQMEMRLSITKNPDVTGDFFATHALQITATLDTETCWNIVAEGATQANVGSQRQLNWIVLPGADTEIVLTADVEDFEMSALAINGVKMELGSVSQLTDGLAELSSHNDELVGGAAQIVQAVIDTANAELAKNKDDFARLGITLNTLTMDNYAGEVNRLQEELLAKVDNYVYQQAEAVLRSEVNAGAADLVRQEVEAAARQEVEAQVRAGAADLVRQEVEAAARKEIEAAVGDLSNGDIETLVDQQMQSAEVQAMIDAETEKQMQSETVQSMIDTEMEALVRPQVEAAAKVEVRKQIEAVLRDTTRQGVEAAVKVRIGAEVAAEMAGAALPTLPAELPTFPPLPTWPTATEAPAEPPVTQAPTAAPTAEPTVVPTDAPVTAVPTQEPTAAPTEAPATPEPTAEPTLFLPTFPPVPTLDTSALPTFPSLWPTEAPQTEPATDSDLLSWLFASAQAEDAASWLDEVEAEVERRMADAKVQQEIDTLTDEAMTTSEMQALIDMQVETQMQSSEVQAMIDAEVEKQLNDPNNRALAEEAARAEVRKQVEDAARDQVRAAVLEGMSGEGLAGVVDQQMQSAEIQAMIDAETEKQLQSGAVESMIDAEVDKQMKSSTVQAMIDAETDKQLQTSAVKMLISAEIANQKNSSVYLNSVAAALKANGKDGAAYQALVELRATLDDVMTFYDGLVEYTGAVQMASDAVGQAASGGGVVTSFTSEKNGEVASVQFVISVPAVAMEEQEMEETVEEEKTIWEKFLDLFS